jgi:hypothetical protein
MVALAHRKNALYHRGRLQKGYHQMNQRVLLMIGLASLGLLTACADQQANAYRKDPKIFLKELVYCQDNYATVGNTPQCRSAFKVNSELFPE